MSKVLISILGVMLLGAGALTWWWMERTESLPPMSQSPTLSSQGVTRIVAFGDSLTAGYNLALDDAYPAQLERALQSRGYRVEVVNAGVSGETSAGGVRRASFIQSLEPDIVLLGLGGNDALRLLSPEALEQNLAETIRTLKTGDPLPQILLLGMRAPANADRTYRAAFDAVYPRIAREFALPLIPFWLDGVALQPEFTLSDGIHPNQAGYAKVIEGQILPALLPLLPASAK